jgi:hypothetical protein
MKIYSRISNSRPACLNHTITATNVSEGYCHFDFKIKMPLAAIFQYVNDDGVIIDSSSAIISYPAEGEVKFASSAGSVAEVSAFTAVADVAGSLNNKYFLISSPTVAYSVWMNINSAGSDPLVAGTTGVEIAAATGATGITIAGAIKTALNALGGANVVFTAVGTTASMVVTNTVAGKATSIGAGNSGFTVSTTTNGVTSPSSSPVLEAGNKLIVVAFRDAISLGVYQS